MTPKELPSQILYDTLKKAIAGRPVMTGVFLTFQFDPSFFETEVLTALFPTPWSNIPKVRLVQLEESLRTVKNVAVYYDRRGLISSAESPKLDYRRLPVSRKTGFFHPKIIFLLVENTEKETTTRTLITCISSANLTQSGIWENVEVFQLLEAEEGTSCTYRQDLRDLLSSIRRESQPEQEHSALDEIQSFVVRKLEDSAWNRRQGRWLPRLYVGNETFPEFVSEFVTKGEFNLEIVSPYFDGGGDNTALHQLLAACEPKETRIFLPVQNDGSAATSQRYYEIVQNLSRTKWAKLPDQLLQRGSQQSAKLTARAVHAKLYRFWNKEREILFAGSVNLTNPGFSSGKGGNLEVTALVEPASESFYTWWLEPLGKDAPERFLDKDKTEGESEVIQLDITFRFHWGTKLLTYYCEEPSGQKPDRIEVAATGSKLFELTKIRYDRWVQLPAEWGGEVESILNSTSFLNIAVDGAAPFAILVQEEGMHQKPSLLRELTAQEILNYWSLLSPAQREQFLIQRMLTPWQLRQEGILPPEAKHPESMFDRFAGIFHAFNQLEQHVIKAIEEEKEGEAVYRLLGEKYDSLPSLVRKVLEAEDEDPVNRYVTLMNARQVLERIKREYHEFESAHWTRFRDLMKEFDNITRVRDRIQLDGGTDRDDFFDWFDRVFLTRMKMNEEQGNS